MRTLKTLTLRAGIVVPATLLVAACADTPNGPGVEIAVAPLTLPGVVDICYGLTVFNADPALLDNLDPDDDPDTVWSLANLCSTQYGNSQGGDISYIGTCDATTGNNYVQLVLETVEVAPPGGSLDDNILSDQDTADVGDAPDFQNPCTSNEPCVLDFPCVENADTFVEFNITVMRRAQQGFFDIAVNFEDIFCSAKVDCVDVEANPITLLHDANGDRGPTLVTAFACTAGPDMATTLHLDDIVLDCDGTSNDVTLDPTTLGNTFLPARAGFALYQASITAGAGQLVDTTSGDPAGTVYWTAALGFDPTLLANCKVTTAFSASAGDNDTTWATPGTRYPQILVDVDVTANGALLACEGDNAHGLDDPDDTVLATTYTTAGVTYDHCAKNVEGDFAFCAAP